MKYRYLYLLLPLFVLLLPLRFVQAEEVQEDPYSDVYDQLDLQTVSESLKKEGISISFADLVDDIAHGDFKQVTSTLIRAIKETLLSDLQANKAIMLQLIGIILIGSIFTNLSTSFGGFISENGFYITYLLMTSLLLSSFSLALSIAMAAMERILIAVRILVPSYILALQFIGGTASSAGTYSIVMISIWLLQAVIRRVVFPLVQFYVVLSLVNHLQKEDSFSKLCDLVKSIVQWILRSILFFVVGLNLIKGLLEPQIDMLGKTAAKRVLSALPGGFVSVLAGTYLAAGMVIKNSIGVAGMLILFCICFLPFLKIFLIMFAVRVTAAIVQPMGDKRFVDGLSAMAQGMSLLMQTIANALVLFVVTLAIMSFLTGGTI